MYTSVGGIKAVIWTDTLQSFFIYLGLTILIVKGTIDSGELNVFLNRFNHICFFRWIWQGVGFCRRERTNKCRIQMDPNPAQVFDYSLHFLQ